MGMSYQYTAIATGVAATQAIVAAAAGRSVIVHGYNISTTVTGTGAWVDSAATALAGVMTMTAGTPFAMSNSPIPCLRTKVGLGLSLTSGAGTAINGHIVWSYDL